ncbi:hypothetical protein [Pseudomonas viridiflava]|uniref:hypothetical protein n=1 Tax=Pseudomonas viridiflava TaxID=33069 RepID=UPI0013C2DD51|nr:hypothetical protein [Pseudomonas viridiflava]
MKLSFDTNILDQRRQFSSYAFFYNGQLLLDSAELQLLSQQNFSTSQVNVFVGYNLGRIRGSISADLQNYGADELLSINQPTLTL